MTDLDCLELDKNANPIAVISTKLIPIDDMSPEQMCSYVENKGYLTAFDTKAYRNVANRLGVPAFLLVYKRNMTDLYVFPLNMDAQKITPSRRLDYLDWYGFMCQLHGVSAALTPDQEEELRLEIQKVQVSEDAAEQLVRSSGR